MVLLRPGFGFLARTNWEPFLSWVASNGARWRWTLVRPRARPRRCAAGRRYRCCRGARRWDLVQEGSAAQPMPSKLKGVVRWLLGEANLVMIARANPNTYLVPRLSNLGSSCLSIHSLFCSFEQISRAQGGCGKACCAGAGELWLFGEGSGLHVCFLG